MRSPRRKLLPFALFTCALAAACSANPAPQRSKPLHATPRPFNRVVTIAIAPDQQIRQLLEDSLVAALGPELAVASYRVIDPSAGEDAAIIRERYLASGIDGALVAKYMETPGTMTYGGGWSTPIIFGGGGEPDLATYSRPRSLPIVTPEILLEAYALDGDRLVFRAEPMPVEGARMSKVTAELVAASAARELRKWGLVSTR